MASWQHKAQGGFCQAWSWDSSPCSSQPLSLPQLCLPSFLQQKMVGQEFLSLGFRLQFSFLKLFLGKDVFLLRAVLPDKFLLEVHLVKMIKMVKV